MPTESTYLLGNNSEISFKRQRFPYSMTGRCLLGLLILFIITTAIFIGLFAHYYIKYNEKGTDIPKADVCTSLDCISSAAAIVKKMNVSADPCTDFSEYACGGFYKDAVIPDGSTVINTYSMLSDANFLVMKDIITESIQPQDPNYLANMKRLYLSCVNVGQIEAIGLTPFLNDTTFINDWPTLNPNWQSSSFNLTEAIKRYAAVFVEPLYMSAVSLDMKNSNRISLYLKDPNLGLAQEYYSLPRNHSVIVAYETYLTEFAVALGANRTIAENDAKGIVDLETALAKIMVPAKDRRDTTKQYNPTPLDELSLKYPGIDLSGALKVVLAAAGVTVASNETVINMFPTYIGNITQVTASFPYRILQNMFGFKYALSRVEGLTKRLREIKLNFDKVYRGKTEETPRWKECLSTAAYLFWKGMSKQFVEEMFSEQAKAYMEEMIDNLKEVFRQMIEEITWMGEETKKSAYKKLAAMKRKIGYPDVNFEVADIEKGYINYTMLDDNFYANARLIAKLSKSETYQLVLKPVDKNEWRMPPYEVNAYYSRSENEIAFPAGLLQPPFFSQKYQDSMNYGGIGMIIGHEMTHGFDDQGSMYDADGNLNNWWHTADKETYVQKTKCIVDQYSGFKVPEINMSVNGINTQGECVADNGGIKESFRAYKALVQKKGEHPALPGLGLTQDQLFFLAYSQLWCEKMTRASLVSQVTGGAHPPGKYRIIGALQNSEDFAKAYNCPRGSYMNPEKKCAVW